MLSPAKPTSQEVAESAAREACRPSSESPAERLLAAFELSELAEQMYVQRLRREGASAEEAQAGLASWRCAGEPHEGDPWFRRREPEPQG